MLNKIQKVIKNRRNFAIIRVPELFIIKNYNLYVNKLNKKKFKAPKEQKFVKFIDKIDYLWFLGLYIFGILFFAYLYHSYEPDSVVIPTFNVDENHNNTFKDLLYFSIVTISTLGYGDYPQLVLEDYLQVWKLSMD